MHDRSGVSVRSGSAGRDRAAPTQEMTQLHHSLTTTRAYLREKVNQLLRVVGTWPLKPEELDDEALISMDPIGIVAESFEQVLEHLKDTNEDLILARDEIQAIFESAGAGIIVVDVNMRIHAYNRLSREFFFTGHEELLGRSLDDLHGPPILPDGVRFLASIAETKSAAEHRDFLRGERHFQVVGTPVTDRQGKVTKVVLLYTDITVQQQIEQSLRDAQLRLSSILNSVEAGILVIDAQTQVVVQANDAAERMLGLPRDKLVGTNCRQLVCTSGLEECPMGDPTHCVDSSERCLWTAAGTKIPVLKSATSVTLMGREHYVESFIDISQRKRAETALQESEERYRSLYSTMNEGVALHELVYDEHEEPLDYRVVDVNPAYERILGMPRAAVVGVRGSEIYGIGNPPYLERFTRVVRTGRPEVFETSFRGRFFYISVVCPGPGKFATLFDDITQRKVAEREVHRLAYTDTLTGLPNRVLLLDRLGEALSRAARERTTVAVLFLDLDRFKPVNDTMGHSVGDALLRAVAERLRACVRSTDTVARVGGDEFVIVLSPVRRALDVTRVAATIRDKLSDPFDCDGREIYTTLSIGIALYPGDGTDPGTLLKSADMAMYVAKDRGRNTYQFYSAEMNRMACERLQMETDLRRALKRGEFFLSYQPQIELTTCAITGVEALIRWDHPGHGVVPPARFIPVCEESGLILPVGQWVLRSACVQNRQWQSMGLAPMKVAVNLSGLQFKQSGLVRRVGRTLAESGLAPEHLELELTESMIMDDAKDTVRTLTALKDMGVSIAIDDFGTGYSSLSYLKKFPIDRIKIAQDFVRELSTDPGDAAIVETIIAMARSLNLKVIAEGVETHEQLAFLSSRGCTDVQGYYFSRPIPGDTLTQYFGQWLRSGQVCPFRLT